MKDIKFILFFLFGLVFKPIKTIKNDEFNKYNTKYLNSLYILLSITVGIIISKYIPQVNKNPNKYLISLIIIPIIVYIGMKLQIFLYYLLLKFINRRERISYNNLNLLLLPILLIFLLINSILMVITIDYPFLKVWIVIITNIWLNSEIYYLLLYKLNLKKVNALLICLISFLLSVIGYI